MQNARRRDWLFALGALSAAAALPGVAQAADWPSRSVNVIVPFPPGGPVDTTARHVTQALGARWSVPVVIDNRAGAGGIVGAQAAAKAPADGQHYFFSAIHHAVLPSLHESLSYDITTDFVPVGMAARFPIVLVVHESLPVTTVAELIDYARANPGTLSYGSSGTGGGTHLAGALFNHLADVELQHVPYRGSAPAMQDLLGGQVQVMFADGPSARPHLAGGRVRALAVGTPVRSALFPELPTLIEAGLPGYEAYSWSGVFAPAGTPPEAVARFNADLQAVLNDPATAEALLAAGAEPQAGSPEDFGVFLRAEIDKWGEVIREADIRIEG